MKALVTGAAGFVGSHMVDLLLARNFNVVALDHRLKGKCLSPGTLKRVDPIESDIRDATAVLDAARGCSAIFHFAAVVGVEAYDRRAEHMAEVERMGVHNICRAASELKVPVVYASSSAVYGRSEEQSGHREDAKCYGTSNYARSKLESERALGEASAASGFAATALRIFNVYGPRQDDRLVVPRFIRLARANEPIVIYGDGRQTRDFVYVGDVVEAALASSGRVSGFNILNACTGQETSIRELAVSVIELLTSSSAIEMRPQPEMRTNFEVDRSFGNVEKLSALLSRPLVPLSDGLKASIPSPP